MTAATPAAAVSQGNAVAGQKIVFNRPSCHYPWPMDTHSAQALSLNELFQLMHFYAESGVDWLIEDEPQDRFAEFAAQEAARAQPAGRPAAEAVQARGEPAQRAPVRTTSPTPSRPVVAIPDAEAISEARKMAAAASTLDELAAAIGAFGGCNLRNSARNTVFMTGNPTAPIAIAAGMPSADDDREGLPFSGPAGAMLGKMLAGIGLTLDEVLLFNFIPWRPPGNRQPTPHELEICRPFGMRLIDLLRPKAVLALGNFSARFLSGSNETIHGLRGKWFDVTAGAFTVPAMATFHPQDLTAAPACKRLAWQDLLAFRQMLTN